MGLKQVDKFLDMSQFPMRRFGNRLVVDWKNTPGKEIDFMYDHELYQYRIIENLDKDRCLVSINNGSPTVKSKNALLNIVFKVHQHRNKHTLNPGDTYGTLTILDTFYNNRGDRCYQCQCSVDGYIFDIKEHFLLKQNQGCPVCNHSRVIPGINDISTTHPDLVKYFFNESDTKKYSAGSHAKCLIICPNCGKTHYVTVSKLTSTGFSCLYCSDGFSYPNKYCRDFFSQLKSQYLDYISEWNPYWSKRYKYDNYIKLLNGDEIIVEIDGGFHFRKGYKNNDSIKDKLAEQNNIRLIRVAIDYSNISNRSSLMKSALINNLSNYFDLRSVDWKKCNEISISSKIINVIDLYNQMDHKQTRQKIISVISNMTGLCSDTIRKYLKIGHDLGICDFPIRKFKST